MPFLVPALVALTCDLLILAFLGRSNRAPKIPVYDANDQHSWVYRVYYMTYLAMARLFLLLIPLLFHSYTGTALRCTALYQLLYWCTLLVLIGHMLSLSLVNPESLEAFSPIDYTSTNMDIAVLHELRRIWWILSLSLASDTCHLVLFFNVRSTGPNDSLLIRQPSVYYALRSAQGRKKQQQHQQQHQVHYHDDQHHQQQYPPDQEDSGERHDSGHQSGDNGSTSRAFQIPTDDEDGDPQVLMQAMGEFLDDIQLKLQRTKVAWAARLEDFSRRISSQDRPTPIANNNPLNPQLTPFRVLLQLFADEDVIENGKLDYIFDLDDGMSMTFFVPQLLSFLLHGALYKSQNLEEWILSHCQRNVYFAHRCYWFLRAWCLEVPAEPSVAVHGRSASRTNSSSRLSALNNGSAASLNGGGLVPFLDEPVSPQPRIPCAPRSNGSRGGVDAPGVPGSAHSRMASAEKLLPEERLLIERLMLRVKECGEGAAATLAYGDPTSPEYYATTVTPMDGIAPEDTSSNAANVLAINTKEGGYGSPDEGLTPRSQSASELMMAAESGAIPIDPSTGFPSVKHLDCVSARRRFGFLPLDGAHKSGGLGEIRDTIPEYPSGSQLTTSETEQFDKTPQFLDALIFLADNLFHVVPSERRTELRNQLRVMECELLPSNSIYMPIGNVHHRVWRIVADESIPIGTKERVPCFVCLEVVDFNYSLASIKREQKARPWGFLDRFPRGRGVERTFSAESAKSNSGSVSPPLPQRRSPPPPSRPRSSSSSHTHAPLGVSALRRATSEGIELLDISETESEIIYEWRFARRDPLRRTSLLDKVTSSVVENMKTPLIDKMKHAYRDRSRSVNDELRSLVTGGDESSHLHHHHQRRESANPPPDEDDVEIGAANAAKVRMVDKVPDIPSSKSLPPKPPSSGAIPGVVVGTGNGGRLSRVSSSGSMVSMGQWMTPEPSERRTIQPRLHDGAGAKRRLSDRFMGDDSETPSLPYGSDHEEDFSESPNKITSKRVDSSSAKSVKRPPVVFRESWQAKEERIRSKSAFGSHPGWRLLTVMIKANDDLRQEQLACQLIYRMAAILAREKIPVWLCPYEIIALTDRGGIVEAIPDTISIDSLKRNDPNFCGLKYFFLSHFAHTPEDFADAQANFVESLAAYSIVCFLLQIKDRHNGNILLDNRGHIIHIDFGFFFLSSPGKNVGFESAPFKLSRDFVEVLGGPQSRLFRTFRELCIRTFLALRKHCMEIILLVEMLKTGNEELNCFRGRPDEAIAQLRERFRLDLNDRACREYVNSLVDDSIENWRTDWYDRYQRYCVGVL